MSDLNGGGRVDVWGFISWRDGYHVSFDGGFMFHRSEETYVPTSMCSNSEFREVCFRLFTEWQDQLS